MPIVQLILHFAAREGDVPGIDDHDKVTTVSVGAEEGLVLSTEDRGDLTGDAADDLVLRIDQMPLRPGLLGSFQCRILDCHTQAGVDG